MNENTPQVKEEEKPVWNPDTYLETESETAFAEDDLGPMIGQALQRNPNELDITHMNRAQRRHLIRKLGLKLTVDNKVTDPKEELKRRKLRRKRMK